MNNTDTERAKLAAKILAGFAANPAIFASNANHGWGLVNATDRDVAGYAVHLADLVNEAVLQIPAALPSAPSEGPSDRVKELSTLVEELLFAAENADETGYVTDVGFIDLDKLHDRARAALKGDAR
jgi:hypothetical protein